MADNGGEKKSYLSFVISQFPFEAERQRQNDK